MRKFTFDVNEKVHTVFLRICKRLERKPDDVIRGLISVYVDNHRDQRDKYDGTEVDRLFDEMFADIMKTDEKEEDELALAFKDLMSDV